MLNLIKGQLKERVVLVVEDEPDSLEIAVRLLTLAGATVLTATNGCQGLEIAAAHKPEFILVDLSMPVMDGWEMQRELRNNPDMANIPVIALTAHAMQNVKEQVMAAGFAAHISKPFDPRRFIAQVLQIAEQFRGSSTAVESGH
jgi:two-component system cell cycle response regulator DivK